jgi:hypothetical protein
VRSATGQHPGRRRASAACDLSRRPSYFFFSLTISDCVCETGLPPSDDWNVSLIVTGRPLRCLSAVLTAFSAEALGLSVNLTVPAAVTVLLPLANTIFAGRHLPLSLMKPVLHFLLPDANAPNPPFWKVSNQENVPGSPTDSVNVIAPVVGLKAALPAVKRCWVRAPTRSW